MGVEIERKFLVDLVPSMDGEIRRIEMVQGYVTMGPTAQEVRIRRESDRCVLNVKSGVGTVRSETEVELSAIQFETLWECTEGRRLTKTRYLLPYGKHTIELDIYYDMLEGLAVAEVEFDSLEESQRFEPPAWFGREISETPEFKNSRLARSGLPEDFVPARFA